MPFEILRNDITKMAVDAIVNSANPRPVAGLGTDSSIHGAAGPELLAARQRIGNICVGQAAITPGFQLQARYVIHTVGPVWDGGSYGEEKLLKSCYENSLRLAREYGCRSIAFPLIATNNYGFPKDKALQIAISAFSEFLLEWDMQIYLVVFDRNAYRLSEKLVTSIKSYIDDNYVNQWERSVYGSPDQRNRQISRRQMDLELYKESILPPDECLSAPMAAPMAANLQDMLRHKEAGFAQTLFQYIDASGRKDSEIYKKANLSKQHFSKIRSNPNYKPTKPTALALAIALELDLEKTKDLIGRAGFALTNSSKFDLIIRYFIENRNYNILEINMALYEFDQNLLGSA